MKRNKWKKNYDEKVANILGMRHQTAFKRLERLIILDLARKLDKNECPHCGFRVDDVSELSIEHLEPWGGNVAKGIEPNAKKFWDMNNIAFSHATCNNSAGCGGSGKYSYVGVEYVCDKRRNPPAEYARASITVNGNTKTLGYFKTPEEAAIARDLALFYYKYGRGKLNFEAARGEYELYVSDNIPQQDNPRKAIKLGVQNFLPRILQGIENRKKHPFAEILKRKQ